MSPMKEVTEAEESPRKTILIAEDEAIVRSMICDVLERENYSVLQAENGLQELNVFEHNKANILLVIADVLMPEMNGIELRNRIHLISPETKILFISGYVQEETRHKVGLTETDILLPKPFEVETL